MKKIFITTAVILISFQLYSQDKGFGLGIIAGEPTGISLKGWLSPTSAVDAGIAWSFIKEGSLHIHADYLHHIYGVFDVSSGKLPLYMGVGGRLKIKNNKSNFDNTVGVRVPFGIAYLLGSAPLDIFLEVVPTLDLTPKTDLKVNGGIGFRYFFN